MLVAHPLLALTLVSMTWVSWHRLVYIRLKFEEFKCSSTFPLPECFLKVCPQCRAFFSSSGENAPETLVGKREVLVFVAVDTIGIPYQYTNLGVRNFETEDGERHARDGKSPFNDNMHMPSIGTNT